MKIGPSGSKLRYAGYAFLSKYVFYAFGAHMRRFDVSGPAICMKFRPRSNGIGPGTPNKHPKNPYEDNSLFIPARAISDSREIYRFPGSSSRFLFQS